jgi:hypothetical protein
VARSVRINSRTSDFLAIHLAIKVYTNKQMLVRVYLDPRRSSTTPKSAESGNYETFLMVLYCHFIKEVTF